MTDPLNALADQTQRKHLELLRDLDGQVESSAALRSKLPGFKGQKGIYQPRGSQYALWIRQTLRRAYPDREPTIGPDGSWEYDYSPEGRGGSPAMTLSTNRALQKCMEDGVPVGVLRQVASVRGQRRYEIRGLGYVTGFDGSHFRIRGEPIDVSRRPLEATASLEFRPFEDVAPHLEPTLRRIRDVRFKLEVRRVYHERCSLCNLGYRLGSTPLALEAAHVIPVQNHGTSDDIRNGLLLCSNHHTLFDGYAWTVDEDLRVRVTSDATFRKSAVGNHVMLAEGKRLPNLPDRPQQNPDPVALRFRLDLFEEHQ